MKYAVILAACSILSLPAMAADAPPKSICVQAQRKTDYNARPINQHDVLIQNSVGDRRPLRLATTCIHIYPDSFVAVRSAFYCVGVGDQVSARTIDGQGESCRVSKVTPFVPDSIQAPYK